MNSEAKQGKAMLVGANWNCEMRTRCVPWLVIAVVLLLIGCRRESPAVSKASSTHESNTTGAPEREPHASRELEVRIDQPSSRRLVSQAVAEKPAAEAVPQPTEAPVDVPSQSPARPPHGARSIDVSGLRSAIWRSSQPPPSGRVYVDELEPVAIASEIGRIGRYGRLAFDARPAKIVDGRYEPPLGKTRARFQDSSVTFGLVFQGNTSAEYRIGGQYQYLRGTVAKYVRAPRELAANEPFVFRIWGDGELRWESPPVKQSADYEELLVDVRGVDHLRLQMQYVGQASQPPTDYEGLWVETYLSAEVPDPRVTALFDPNKLARRGEYELFLKRIDRALGMEDFIALENIVAEARASGEFFHARPSLFYAYVRLASVDGGQSDYRWLRRMAILERWRERFPESPAPVIALIAVKLNYVESMTHIVTHEHGHRDQRAMMLIEHHKSDAARLIEELEEFEIDDPHGLFVRVLAARLADSPQAEIISLLNEAADRFPDYWPIYEECVPHLMTLNPAEPGVISRLAVDLRQRIGGELGDELYAQMAIICERYRGLDPVADCGFDSQLLSPGLRKMAIKYCDSDTILHHVCQQACRIGDDSLASAMLGQLGRLGAGTMRPDVWKNAEQRNAYRRQFDSFLAKPHAPLYAHSLEARGERMYNDRVSFSADGSKVFSSGNGLAAWDSNSGAYSHMVRLENPIIRAGFKSYHAVSPDGRFVASHDNDAQLTLYDAQSLQPVRKLGEPPMKATALAFTPDSQQLIVATGPHAVEFRSVETGDLLRRLTVHEGNDNRVIDLAISPDGKTLATCGADRLIYLWHFDSLQQRAVLGGHDDEVSRVVFSPRNDVLASGSRDGTIKIWDLASDSLLLTNFQHAFALTYQTLWQENQRVVYHSPRMALQGIAFSPQGDYIATSANLGHICYWNYRTGSERGVFPAIGGAYDIAISPDGKRLATISTVARELPYDARPFYEGGLHVFDIPELMPESDPEIQQSLANSSPPMVHFPRKIEVPEVRSAAPLYWEMAKFGESVYLDGPLKYASIPNNLRNVPVTRPLSLVGGLEFEVSEPVMLTVAVAAEDSAKPMHDTLVASGWEPVDLILLSDVEKRMVTYQRMCNAGERYQLSADGSSTALLFGSVPVTGPCVLPRARLHGSARRHVQADAKGKGQVFELKSDLPVTLSGSRIRLRAYTPNDKTRGKVMISWPGQDWIEAANWDGKLRESVVRRGGWHEFTVTASPGAAIDQLSVRFVPQGVRGGDPVELLEVQWAAAETDDSIWRQWSLPVATLEKTVVPSPEHRKAITVDGAAYCVAYSPRNDRFITGHENFRVREWDPSTLEQRQVQSTHYVVYGVNYSPNGDRYVATGASGDTSFFHPGTDNNIYQAEPTHGMAIAWEALYTPQGNELINVGWGVSSWTINDKGNPHKRKLDIPGGPNYLHGAVLNPDGTVLYTGNDQGKIERWDLSGPNIIKSWEAHPGPCKQLVVFDDGKKLATSSPRDPLIRIWNEATGEPLGVLEGHETGVSGLALAPDGEHLISGSCWRTVMGPYDDEATDTSIRVWHLPSFKQIARLDGHASNVTDLAISPDGASLVSAGTDSTIHLWDLSRFKLAK